METHTTKPITREETEAFLADRAKFKEDLKDANSEIMALHKKLIDEKGISKKGLLVFAQFAEMEPNKRADALRTFDALRAQYGNEWLAGLL